MTGPEKCGCNYCVYTREPREPDCAHRHLLWSHGGWWKCENFRDIDEENRDADTQADFSSTT